MFHVATTNPNRATRLRKYVGRTYRYEMRMLYHCVATSRFQDQGHCKIGENEDEQVEKGVEHFKLYRFSGSIESEFFAIMSNLLFVYIAIVSTMLTSKPKNLTDLIPT